MGHMRDKETSAAKHDKAFRTPTRGGVVSGRIREILFRSKGVLFSVAIVLAVFLAYQPVWRGGFVWDDDIHLLSNPVLNPGGLFRAWFCPGTYLAYWPLTFTVYRLEYAAWGLNPIGYHLMNIVWHAVASLLVWRVLATLKMPGAMLAAAIFALHPVNVDTVAWIAQFKGTLSLSLALLSMLFFLRYERDGNRWRFAAAVALYLFSTLAKGLVLTFPVVLLACAWWQRGVIRRQDVLRSIPFFLVAASMVGMEVYQQQVAAAHEVVRADGLLSRAAVAGCAVWFYLGKFLWPTNLMFMYPRWAIDSQAVASYVPGVLLVVLLAWAWRRRRGWGRPVVMALVCYVVLLLPVLGFTNIYFMLYSFVADHWQYPAIIVPCAAFAAAATTVTRRLPPVGRSLLCLVLLGVLAVLTFRQSGTYRDIETLYRTTLERNPGCFLVHNNLGVLLSERGQNEEAEGQFLAAVRSKPDYADAHTNLGSLLADEGRTDEAIEHLRTAVACDPTLATANFYLGGVLFNRGQVDEAIEAYRSAVKHRPSFVEAQNNLGAALNMRGEFDEAIEHFQTVLKFDATNVSAVQNIDMARTNRDRLLNLLAERRVALRARPDGVALLNNTAWLLATNPNASIRDGAEAVALAQRAVVASGGKQPAVLGTLAAAYAEVGRFAEAVKTAEQAAALAGDDVRFADTIRTQIACYAAGSPYRELQQPPPHDRSASPSSSP